VRSGAIPVRVGAAGVTVPAPAAVGVDKDGPMSPTYGPDPLQDLARQISESLTVHNPALESVRRSLADAMAVRNAHVTEVLNQIGEGASARLGQQLTRLVAPALEASRAPINQAAAALAESARSQLAGVDTGFRLNLPRLDFDAVLASPFDALPAEQREWARQVVDEATAHVDAGLAEETDGELLDTLADTARTFAAAQPAGLSWDAQKKLFVGFIVTVVFLLLLQAQIESDAVKELVEDAGGAALVIAPTALGAAFVWNKMNPLPGRGEQRRRRVDGFLQSGYRLLVGVAALVPPTRLGIAFGSVLACAGLRVGQLTSTAAAVDPAGQPGRRLGEGVLCGSAHRDSIRSSTPLAG
jgi:hypothetical protein